MPREFVPRNPRLRRCERRSLHPVLHRASVALALLVAVVACAGPETPHAHATPGPPGLGAASGGPGRDAGAALSSTMSPASTAEDGAPALLVLSWNVCWQAMTGTSAASAPRLGELCEPVPGTPELTDCARTMAAFLRDAPAAVDPTREAFDLVALQEASRWEALVAAAGPSLGGLAVVRSTSGPEEMVTLHAPSLVLERSVLAEFRAGRPFQVLLFAGDLVFVNLHADHDVDVDDVERALSAALVDALTPEERVALRDDRIVVAGDFNRIPSWDGRERIAFRPFVHAGIDTEVRAIDPPLSCCYDGVWGERVGFRAGDHVLDSRAPAHGIVPPNHDPTRAQSDHLPVAARLAPRAADDG